MNERYQTTHSVVVSITGLITFLAFVIIYYNLVFSTGAFRMVIRYADGWLVPFKMLIVAILGAPILLALFVVLSFLKNLAVELFQLWLGLKSFWGLLQSVTLFGAFLGIITFVAVISVFVALQSHIYLTSISPRITAMIEQWLN